MNETLLLLPGMMCDERLFRHQIERLRVHRPIKTPALTGQDSVAELSHKILANAPPRFAVAGLSMGGIVAMEMIRVAPERITKLALMDTNPFADPIDRIEQRNRQIKLVRAGGLKTVIRDEMKPNYLADGPNKTDILNLCMAMAESLGPDVFVDQSRALQTRPDQTNTLSEIAVPTLVLCGQEDVLCPIDRHRLMHDLIPNSHLAIIPDAGHLPTLEQPERTTSELERWLNQ